MPLRSKPLDCIEESDLQSLIDDQVLERKTIEYKEALLGGTDSAKKEFLADVSSFANSSGGDLIFGIRDTSGIPSEVCGLQIANVDAEKLRLENIIRNGVEPRIPGVSIRALWKSALFSQSHLIADYMPKKNMKMTSSGAHAKIEKTYSIRP